MSVKRKKSDYICQACREADRKGDTHPGQMHAPGVCDCECRDD